MVGSQATGALAPVVIAAGCAARGENILAGLSLTAKGYQLKSARHVSSEGKESSALTTETAERLSEKMRIEVNRGG